MQSEHVRTAPSGTMPRSNKLVSQLWKGVQEKPGVVHLFRRKAHQPVPCTVKELPEPEGSSP